MTEITMETLADVLGVSDTTIRTWLGHWSFNKFVERRRVPQYKRQRATYVTLSNEFKKKFLNYLQKRHIGHSCIPTDMYANRFIDFLNKTH